MQAIKYLDIKKYRLFWISSIQICMLTILHAQPDLKIGALLYTDDFNAVSSQWILETEATQPAKLLAKDGQLMLDVPKDATLWFRQLLQGNFVIDFYREVKMQGGPHDRLSDMNFFWMASDPHNANLFTRNGIFRTYDSLLLYYAGIGGNFNTTSRFRKYTGDGKKAVLQEYSDTAHLLQPNHRYHIQVVVQHGTTELWIDEKPYFHWTDPAPLTKGFFGIRTTKSRQIISGFRIYRLL